MLIFILEFLAFLLNKKSFTIHVKFSYFYSLAAALNDLYLNNIVREACTSSQLNQQ